MGVVYLGRLEGAAGFSKAVVIKRVIPDMDNLEETTARFIREAQILSNLQHPGIVAVLDFGEEVGGHCMVLEYVHGYDLSKWLKFLQLTQRQMPWEHAVYIMLRVLEALSYSHNFRRSDGMVAEVLHRDVSPGNILLDVEGRVRLADFGIARMDEGDTGEYRTQVGVLKGKVAYLAPELFSGSPPSPSSDLYACALVLYQMLAGRNPFSAENESRVMWRLIMEPPRPLSDHRDDLPAELQTAVLRALEKKPAERHQSAEAFAEHLRSTLARRETVIAAELRDSIRADFTGDLPGLLRLEPLSERDLAWRTGSGIPPAEATAGGVEILELDSASAPAAPTEVSEAPADDPELQNRSTYRSPDVGGQNNAARAPLGLFAPRLPSARGSVGESESTMTSVGASRRRWPHGFDAGPAESSPQSGPISADAVPSAMGPMSSQLQMKHVVGIGLSIGAVVAVALAAMLLVLRPTATTTPSERFIVVESPQAPVAAARPDAPATAQPALGEISLGQAAPAEAAPSEQGAAPVRERREKARPRPESDASMLSRQFAKQQSKLQGCFERHAADVEGRPRLSLGFDVSENGTVRAATLTPASVAGTSLGRCLLKVARGTEFSSRKAPVRFTIPIQARAVKR